MEKNQKKIKKYWWLNFNVIGMILIIKVLILVFAIHSYQTITDQPLNESYQFLEIWKRWDAVHYLHLAENGYTATGEHRFLIVFFPLYPILVSVFNFVTGDSVVSAFIVSGICSVILGLVFAALVRLDYSDRISRNSVLFMFIFPTSYFLHIPYTESLFLALCISSFFAARKRSWMLAAVLGSLACFARINGIFLLPALLFEIWDEYRDVGKINRQWFWVGLIPTGIISYLLLNYVVTGNPTMFMEYQREHWGRYFRLPWYGLWEAWKSMFNKGPSASVMNGFQELLFVGIGFFAIVLGWKEMRNSYRFWMVGNWLLFISTSFVLSVPRYTLVLFPLFILMALLAVRNWYITVLFTVWSILYLSLFTTQFVRGWWAF